MTEESRLNYSANHIYREGYEQGRADKYQEITSEYMLLTEKQVADIRVDVIDKIISYLNDCRLIEDSKVCYECLSELMEKIEQLKGGY